MARARAGDWDGSNVIEDHITYLRNTRRLPDEGYVKARVPPEEEISPALEEGERVSFRSHFHWGFGLPESGFLRSFLQFYHLQPHHLTPNTVVLLSAFITLCEGYLGVLPTLELWGEFFYTKLGVSAKDKAAQCGAFVAVRRPGAGNRFPSITLTQSVKLS